MFLYMPTTHTHPYTCCEWMGICTMCVRVNECMSMMNFSSQQPKIRDNVPKLRIFQMLSLRLYTKLQSKLLKWKRQNDKALHKFTTSFSSVSLSLYFLLLYSSINNVIVIGISRFPSLSLGDVKLYTHSLCCCCSIVYINAVAPNSEVCLCVCYTICVIWHNNIIIFYHCIAYEAISGFI